MKKSLSLLLSIALVFSMFASMASANETELSTQQKYDQLKEAGIFQGYPDGTAGLDKEMKRSQFATVLQRVLDLEDAEADYTDVSATYWAAGAIGAVSEAGLLEGKGAGKFDPEGYVKVEELAAIALRALGFDAAEDASVEGKVDSWAVGYVAAALELGLIPTQADYTVFANRGQLVDVTFEVVVAIIGSQITVTSAVALNEKTVEVTLSNEAVVTVELETALELGKATEITFTHEGVEYTAEVTFTGAAVASASAVGVKTIKVVFAAAVDTSKVTVALKKGTTVWNVNKSTWNEAKTELTLETSVNLTAGDYSVTASGVQFAEGKDAATFTVAPERVESVEVDTNGYRKAASGTDYEKVIVSYSLKNQYGEKVNGNIVATPTVGVAGTITADAVEINNIVAGVTSFNLTIVDTNSGKSGVATVTVQNARIIHEIELGAPVIPTGDTVLKSGKTGIVIPVTAKDQYGNAIKLLPTDITTAPSKLTFITNDSTAIGGYAINSDGNLTFNTSNFEGPKSLFLQVVVNGSGKSARVDFTVNGAASPVEPTLVLPSTRFGVGDTYKVELQVTDQYGSALSADDIVAAYNAGKFTIAQGNTSVYTTNQVIYAESGKAYINLVGTGQGNAVLTVTVNGTGKSSTININVVEAKYAHTVTLAPNYTKAVSGATITLKATFKDQYGDDFNPATAGAALVEISNDNNTVFGTQANQSVYALINTGVAITPNAADKSAVFTVKLKDASNNVIDTKTVTLTTAKADEALTYKVEDIGTVSDKAAGNYASQYSKQIKVYATDASSTKVALQDNVITDVISANPTVLGVARGTGAEANVWKVSGKTDQEGSVIVNVIVGSTPVQTTVTVSKAQLAIVSIVAKQNDTVVTKVSFTGAKTIANVFTSNADLWIDARDQFNGTSLSNNANVAVFVTTPGGITTKEDGALVFNANGTWKVTVSTAEKTINVEVVVSGITP